MTRARDDRDPQPDLAAGSRHAHLQPEQSTQWADSEAERRKAAEIDARLAGDRQVMAMLTTAGFDGPTYEYVRMELARYGMGVLEPWCATGKIFEKCQARGYGLSRPRDQRALRIDAQSLAGETMSVALNHFRDEVLIPGKWDPSRGASIATYFIGQCLIRFPNVYRRWLRDADQAPILVSEELQGIFDRPGSHDVEEDVIVAQAGHEALSHVKSAQARTALVMSALGYTHPEIADRTGQTIKAVERSIAYARQQVNKWKEERRA